MTAADIQDLFLTQLVRQAGGTRRRWRAVVGDVRVYSLATHAHCNWSVSPSGGATDVARVERLADDIRARHPIISAR